MLQIESKKKDEGRAARSPPSNLFRGLLEPFGIFKYYSSPLFVVDAASPRSDHLKWLKKVSP